LSTFRHKQRRGEIHYFQKKFTELGFSISKPRRFYEGHGDTLPYGNDYMIFGYGRTGLRSSKTGVISAACFLEKKSPVFLPLINEHFYHLDTCFCPIADTILYYPPAFTKAGKSAIRGMCHGAFIEASKKDAENFVCNSVPVETASGWKLISNKPTAKLTQELRDFGIQIIEVDTSEFKKAGGGPRCLTIFI